MKIEKLDNFDSGWFIGDFSPTAFPTKDFEVCVKHFKAGDYEPSHFQRVATEFTIVISGECRMGSSKLLPGHVLILDPGEVCDFEAIKDSIVLGIKTPSIPGDKVLAGE